MAISSVERPEGIFTIKCVVYMYKTPNAVGRNLMKHVLIQSQNVLYLRVLLDFTAHPLK